MFGVAVVGVVAKIRRRKGGVRCDGFTDESRESYHFTRIGSGVLCNIGDSELFHIREVGGGPFHGASTQRLNPYSSVVLNDVSHHGDRRPDGWHGSRPVPP